MESMNCPYEEKCRERHTEPEMEEKRKTCDCINCAFCDYYWWFYDRSYLKKLNMK